MLREDEISRSYRIASRIFKPCFPSEQQRRFNFNSLFLTLWFSEEPPKYLPVLFDWGRDRTTEDFYWILPWRVWRKLTVYLFLEFLSFSFVILRRVTLSLPLFSFFSLLTLTVFLLNLSISFFYAKKSQK